MAEGVSGHFGVCWDTPRCSRLGEQGGDEEEEEGGGGVGGHFLGFGEGNELNRCVGFIGTLSKFWR